MIILEYEGSQFHEVNQANSNKITLTIDEAAKKMILYVPHGASLIQRRAAERQARGFVKTGYHPSSGGRVGVGFEFVVEGEGGNLPDILTKSPREVY